MGPVAGSVPRLGLDAVSFSSEALRGVWATCVPTSASKSCECSDDASGACTGDCACATIFPSVISQGATFDNGLWKSIGSAVGREGRALQAFGGKTGTPSSPAAEDAVGAVFHAPNVNVLRDGRWGRAQELASEDPHVIADYAYNFIGGLQYTSHKPNSSAYVLGLGVCEYFAGYSLDCVTSDGNACGNSDSMRHDGASASAATFNAEISAWDLSESYLPAFGACANSLAGGVACAPNSVNGVPACANTDLINGSLRNDFGFEGFITASGNAVAQIATPFHNYTKTVEEAAVAALLAGTDSDSGASYNTSLTGALSSGLIATSDIDAAVMRLLVARLRLGNLDYKAGTSAFGSSKTSDLSSSTHTFLNERASYEGIVLLQNNVTGGESSVGKTSERLPLDVASISSIAMVGPHADARLNMLGYEYGSYVNGSIVSPRDFIISRLGSSVVTLEPGCNVTTGNQESLDAAVSAAKAADVVIAGLGLCGSSPGYGDASCSDANGAYEVAGYDRASIALPAVQVDLIKAIAATGTPIVVFLLNGGPVDISDIVPLVEGVIWAGYPGSTGGKAIGSAFLGLLSPGSVMPYTTHEASYEVSYSNMSMMAGLGRTYKFFKGTPVIPFGFGLSYSKWNVIDVKAPASSATEKEAVNVEFDLENKGPFSGDRVVLLFAEPVVRIFIDFEP